ncbi:hypothetical protein JCM6882_002411 [Rhodosporidiobolus microsporus]
MVRLACLATLALAGASTVLAAAPPAPTAAPDAAAILERRGLLDWLGFGDDNSTSSSSTSSMSAQDQQTYDTTMGFLDLAGNGAQAVNNNSVCAADCTTFVNNTRSGFTISGDSSGAMNLLCNTGVSDMNKCAKCLGGNSTEQAKNWTNYCESIGIKADDNSAPGFLAQGGFAAALVAGGLALLAL